MFNNLIETNAKKQRSAGGAFMSLVLHGALIGVAVVATANAGQEIMEEKQEKVEFVETPKQEEPPPPEPEPEPAPPPPPDVVAAPPPPKGFQLVQPPMNIPDVIPEIDLSKREINEADFTGKGVAGGKADGVVGAPPAPVVDASQTFFEFQVEKPVVQLSGGSPAYPSMLQSQGVKGQVIAQFVVDTTGRVDVSTFKVLESSHDLFTAAVKRALPGMRFAPAEVGGRKVKQLVQQPFVFEIK
ncbi:MAG TPA: TonB family protein [Gemmatimonadaceae bacterium]|jgi:protein TonB|nr:TonB family protein [Gemmatimonadaceae bacterium]